MRTSTDRPVRAWTFGWAGAAVIGVVNGVVRDLTYGPRVGERRAHQRSTATLLAALCAYMKALHRRWPLETARRGLLVGGLWAVLTVAFEFGLGTARGLSWEEMTEDYDVTKGRLWGVVPLFMAVGPALTRRRR